MLIFWGWRYTASLFAWLAVYAVLLLGSGTLLRGDSIHAMPLRVILALLPMIAGFGVLNVVMRAYRQGDELERKIAAESIMFAFGVTALLTFSYGFLQAYVGAPDLSYFFVWPVLGGTWFIGGMLARHRYR